MKLHLGCGGVHIPDCVNVDYVIKKRAETESYAFVRADLRHLPFKDRCADEILSFHVIEHFHRAEVICVLKEWLRALKPGGKIAIECPDFDQNCRDYLAGRNPGTQLLFIFGSGVRYAGDFHKIGFNFDRLEECLRWAGFVDIVEKLPISYHITMAACLRAEARRGNGR